MLLLGIIALKDSSRALVEHWPHVLPALCRGFDDGHSSLRAISCWAAGHCLDFALECGVRAVLSSSFPSFPFLFRVFGFAVLCFWGLFFLRWLSFAALCCAEVCCVVGGIVGVVLFGCFSK